VTRWAIAPTSHGRRSLGRASAPQRGRLATEIADDGFRPDIVLAVAQGGLTVAGAVAYALGVKNCGAMNVEFYTDVGETLDVPVVLPPTLAPIDIRGLRVLIADDVADTGKTLELIGKEIAEHVSETRGAVLYVKPWSIITPECRGRYAVSGADGACGRRARPSRRA
jgi:hypoxanthine phosphoribosyltransferase